MQCDIVALGEDLEHLVEKWRGRVILDHSVLRLDLDRGLLPSHNRNYGDIGRQVLEDLMLYQLSLHKVIGRASVLPVNVQEYQHFPPRLEKIKEELDANSKGMLTLPEPERSRLRRAIDEFMGVSRAPGMDTLLGNQRLLLAIVKHAHILQNYMAAHQEEHGADYKSIEDPINLYARAYDLQNGGSGMVKDAPYISAAIYFASIGEDVRVFALDQKFGRYMDHAVRCAMSGARNGSFSHLTTSRISVFSKSGSDSGFKEYFNFYRGEPKLLAKP
ncbi:MAG: hypothetical protein ABH879_04535 [archaeon]